MTFVEKTRNHAIFLTDVKEPAEKHCRYAVFLKPAGCVTVFTSNKEINEVFPEDEHGAIKRRVHVCHIPLGEKRFVAPPADDKPESDVD
jgi:hypothetical protein